MTGWARIIVFALVPFTAACDGSFSFDRAPADTARTDAGAADAAADAAADGGSCGDIGCNWRREACAPEDEPCRILCGGGATCTAGMCGASCVAECEAQSRCWLSTGPEASVACENESTCEFVLGAASGAWCQSGTTCRVRCLGDCSLLCESGAACQLACGAAAARPVSGNTDCP